MGVALGAAEVGMVGVASAKIGWPKRVGHHGVVCELVDPLLGNPSGVRLAIISTRWAKCSVEVVPAPQAK